jgi:Na+-transporting NADH:ubiquinone oxidoreductase subunit A
MRLAHDLRWLAETAPQGPIGAAVPVTRVAVLGDDYRDLRHTTVATVDSRVRTGDTLFVSRQHPEVRFVAPASGCVRALHLGRQRRLLAAVIEIDDDTPVALPDSPGEGAASIRTQLLEAGLWPALRTRPFERTPAPDAQPQAIYVIATDSRPGSPDPTSIIAPRADAFRRGVELLARLSPRTCVCIREGSDIALPDVDGVVLLGHRGIHPTGLPGTFIHRDCSSLDRGGEVWHIGYQDVLRIGQLWLTGRHDTEHVVSIARPQAPPQLIRSRLGAHLDSLVERGADQRVISGSALDGRETTLLTRYLGRFHQQVTLLDPAAPRHQGRFANLLERLFADGEQCGAMLPLPRFERLWALDVPPLPLLHALLTGNIDVAIALGALALAEEDLALCSYVCPAALDYGATLRKVLTEIEQS